MEKRQGKRGESLKLSLLRYHRELRKELGEGWIQSLNTELQPSVQRFLGDNWKEEAARYINRLEEEDKKISLIKQRAGEVGKKGMEDNPTRSETDKEEEIEEGDRINQTKLRPKKEETE